MQRRNTRLINDVVTTLDTTMALHLSKALEEATIYAIQDEKEYSVVFMPNSSIVLPITAPTDEKPEEEGWTIFATVSPPEQ